MPRNKGRRISSYGILGFSDRVYNYDSWRNVNN